MTTFPTSISEYLHSSGMVEMTVMAYLQLDKSFNLVSWNGSVSQLGVLNLTAGQPVIEQLFFLEGLLPTPTPLRLRFISLNEECYAHVHIIPYDNGTYILFFDAALEYEQQRKMQQQINESKLLAYKKDQFLYALEEKKNVGSSKNTVEALYFNSSIHHKHSNKIVRFIFNLFN